MYMRGERGRGIFQCYMTFCGSSSEPHSGEAWRVFTLNITIPVSNHPSPRRRSSSARHRKIFRSLRNSAGLTSYYFYNVLNDYRHPICHPSKLSPTPPPPPPRPAGPMSPTPATTHPKRLSCPPVHANALVPRSWAALPPLPATRPLQHDSNQRSQSTWQNSTEIVRRMCRSLCRGSRGMWVRGLWRGAGR